MKRPIRRPRPFAILFVLLAAPLLLASCSKSKSRSTTGLTIFTANQAAPAATRVVVSGAWLAYLADEATSGVGGTDFNLDGDKNDAVPVAVNVTEQQEFLLPVAARDLVWLGPHLFLVVDEAQDDRDWNGDGLMDSLVLARWVLDSDVVFVDTLDARGTRQVLLVGGTLFYVASEAIAAGMESTLRAIARDFPAQPRRVFTTDVDGPLSPLLVAEDEGLILLGLDETMEGRDLNGDGDQDDRRVLALLDGTGTAGAGGYEFPVQFLGLASRHDVVAPFRASSKGPNDWLAAFLVNEADQGGTNFNDPNVPEANLPASWQPAQCMELDVDVLDDVLFFVHVGDWTADPASHPPVNTGLVGDERVVIAGDFVGTVSSEAAASCDLNADGDLDDRIFRWVRAETPVLPPSSPELLRAVGALPGGTRGAAELQGRFVLAVNELDDGRDIDGDGFLSDVAFVGWLNPAAVAPTWTFDHSADAEPAWAIATWLGESPDRERLGVAFAEDSNGVDLNGDGDILDSVPAFARIEASRMRFPGFAVAVPPANPGIVFQNGWAFYRVSEALDDRDWNGDGDKTDFLLFRSRLADGQTFAQALLNSIPTRPSVEPTNDVQPPAGAFLVDETLAGDVNADGRADGLVLRYFAW